MQAEKNILNKILLAAPPNVRLFRNNVGVAHMGKVVSKYSDGGSEFIIIQNPRIVKYGLCVGSSDLIGWKTVTITPDMVGETRAIFVAIEAKTEDGRLSEDQLNFLDQAAIAGARVRTIRGDSEIEQIKNI